MLFFVVGLPGRFTEWCEEATVRLVRHACGPAERISADTLEEITQVLLRRGATHGVVGSRDPGFRIRRALVEAGRPFIVVRDDPWASLAHLVAQRELAIAAAAKQVASSCGSMISFGTAPGALMLDPENGDPLVVAGIIADHLQLPIGDAEIAGLVGELEWGEATSDLGAAAVWRDGLAPGDRAIASGALDTYLDHSAGRGLRPITWAPELFFIGDGPPGVCAAGGVEITGRSRCLLRGPSIMLPPATWSLSVAVDVSPEAAEHNFVVEVIAGGVVGRTVIRPAGAGVIEAELILVFDDLPDQPLELLLSNERPAFGGYVTLLGVTLTPQPPASAATPFETGASTPQNDGAGHAATVSLAIRGDQASLR